MKKELPRILHKTAEQINALVDEIKASPLSDEAKELALESIIFATWFPIQLQNNAITINRLRTLLFGKGYSKPTKSPGNETPATRGDHTQSEEIPAASAPENVAPEEQVNAPVDDLIEQPKKEKKPGHGRMPHTVYNGCDDVQLSLVGLTVGSACPLDCGGRLYGYPPGILIRIIGQNLAKPIRYEIEKLRCSSCLEIFSAQLPAEIGTEKYDVSFKTILALMKYDVAVPFYRQEHFQKRLSFPLSDATQWDLIEQLAGSCYPVFNELIRLAAQGELIHNDDTPLKILEVIACIKKGEIGRRGMYTTGLVARYGVHQIALFLNGTQHAGENLEAVLKHRAAELSSIIQMCDGLKANIPKTMQTILCNCLAHGFRKFEEVRDYFPDECLPILQGLGKVFEYDEQTQRMTGEQRLAHHQTHSAPVMASLKTHMASLMDEHRVEPNSELGKSIHYMQTRWREMTQFLEVVGAPIDNNVVERALKIAIRNRKNAMFYKTCYSAHIGGMITSLIYTCDLADENPFDYLNALQKNTDAVMRTPGDWLPWNYRNTVRSTGLAQAA
jgi:transposase